MVMTAEMQNTCRLSSVAQAQMAPTACNYQKLTSVNLQVIKEWYADMPERLGKELAKQRKNNVQKSEADKQEEDNSREEKFLKKEGLSDDAIEEAVHDADYEQDPVTAGQD